MNRSVEATPQKVPCMCSSGGNKNFSPQPPRHDIRASFPRVKSLLPPELRVVRVVEGKLVRRLLAQLVSLPSGYPALQERREASCRCHTVEVGSLGPAERAPATFGESASRTPHLVPRAAPFLTCRCCLRRRRGSRRRATAAACIAAVISATAVAPNMPRNDVLHAGRRSTSLLSEAAVQQIAWAA